MAVVPSYRHELASVLSGTLGAVGYPTPSLLHRHDQPVHDVVLALGRVLAHVKSENRAGLNLRSELDFAQAGFLAAELREFVRADFADTIKSFQALFLSHRRQIAIRRALQPSSEALHPQARDRPGFEQCPSGPHHGSAFVNDESSPSLRLR